jgi:hypothetical protein
MLPTLGAKGYVMTTMTAATRSESDRRVPPDKPIRLAWRDAGGRIRCLPGRCIDMSRKRIHIEVREEIPLHTRVRLRAGAISVASETSVTYVTHYGPTFILVLEIGE